MSSWLETSLSSISTKLKLKLISIVVSQKRIVNEVFFSSSKVFFSIVAFLRRSRFEFFFLMVEVLSTVNQPNQENLSKIFFNGPLITSNLKPLKIKNFH